MRLLLLLPLLLVLGCGPDEDCCAPDPVSPTPTTSGSATPSTDASSDAGATAAEAFAAYAGGTARTAPWADVVRVSVVGERVAELDPAAADRRRSWTGCPSGATTYEGRDCPVSVLTAIRALVDEGGSTVLEDTAPDIIGCNRYTAPETDAVSTTWIRPDPAQRSCFTDFAIAVGVDAAGAVTDVDLALSGP